MAYYKCGKIFATQNSNTSIETASGAIANFNTSLAMPVLDCIAEFSATQDLHGQSTPYPAGGGKNKFNINFLTASGITISNGEASGSAYTFADKFGATKLIPQLTLGTNTQYTLSFDAYTDGASTSGTGLYIAFKYDDESTSDARCPNNTLSYTRFSVSNDTSKNLVGIYISYSSKSSNIWHLRNIQLEEGSPATAYAPYENICPIVGVDKVNFTRTQNNIFTSPIERGNINANGEDTDNLNPNRSRTAKQIAVSPSTEYTVGNAGNYKVGIFYYTSNGTFISFLSWDDTPRTFTTPSNCAFVRFAYQNVSGTYPTKNQLCKGTTLDNYDQTVTTAIINLGGTYYGGSVDAVTGKITKTVGIINDLSDRTWNATSSPHIFYATVNGKKTGYSSFLMCEQYSKYEGYFTGLGNNQISSNTTYPYIYIRNDDCDTPSDLVTALSGVKLAYELATPIVVYASNTAEIPTIVGDNQVYADTGDVEVKYRKLHSDN